MQRDQTEPFLPMHGFSRRVLTVAGIATVIYTIGSGAPLVFLHGAGTFTEFAAARGLANCRTVIVPYHPGFGESADAPEMGGIDDYLIHTMDLLDALALPTFDLMGFSLGGWIAAEYAARQAHRLRRLVLVAPAGLVVPAHPAPDLFAIAPAEIPSYLAADPAVALRYFPNGPDPRFETLIGREMAATARIFSDGSQGNPKLSRWLHRITVPTLLVWGEADRMRPAAQASSWLELLPDGELAPIPHVGHLVFEESPDAIGTVAAFLDRPAHTLPRTPKWQ